MKKPQLTGLFRVLKQDRSRYAVSFTPTDSSIHVVVIDHIAELETAFDVMKDFADVGFEYYDDARGDRI